MSEKLPALWVSPLNLHSDNLINTTAFLQRKDCILSTGTHHGLPYCYIPAAALRALIDSADNDRDGMIQLEQLLREYEGKE